MSPYKIAVSIASLSIMGAGASWADELTSEVMRLAEQQDFDAALALLEEAEPDRKSELEHLLLEARVLSWGGYYQKAASLLGQLKSCLLYTSPSPRD